MKLPVRCPAWRPAAVRALFALLVGFAATLWTSETRAQSAAGNIYGKVMDEQGAALLGAAVTLTGVGAPLTATTAAGGEFRFLNLSPGEYTVAAALTGFVTVERPKVLLGSRENAVLSLTLKVAAHQESVTVTSEPPLLDIRKSNVGANVRRRELEAIPTARDPWVILQSVPGVQNDRVNVGGSESGQQSMYVGKGSPPSQNEWYLEGVVLQQMSGTAGVGTSPLYYDFDSFEEIHVSTGGTDPSFQTPGVQISLVTKRGTNTLRGSARVFFSNDSLEATNIPDELARQLESGGQAVSGNHIRDLQDYGAEVGGPLIADRLWLWAGYGHDEIDLITAGGLTDDTTLKNVNAKLNAQVFRNNAATLFYYYADKLKFGRDAGPTRPQETSWDQTGPAAQYKAEDSHVFGADLFGSVYFAHKDWGFDLVPEGSGQMRQDSTQVFHNTYFANSFDRPDTQAGANFSYFLRTGSLGHELKFGGLYRYNKANDQSLFEGNAVACNTGANWCGNQLVPAAELNRNAIAFTYLYQYSGYLSDTITASRLTVNAGLRYDYQYGVNAPVSIPGSEAAGLVSPETVLPPALDVPEKDPGFRWKDLQPRVGATCVLGSDQKTLARASYARYSNQLGATFITPFSVAPAATTSAGAGVVYPWNDLNGDNHVDAGEVDTSQPPLRFFGFNPADPTNVARSINGVDPGFASVKTDEVTLGLEREVMPSLAVSLLGTYRRMWNFDLSSGFGLTRDNYILSTTTYHQNGIAANPLCPQAGYACGILPDGASYSVPVYQVKPGVPLSAGQFTRNNPGYHQTYYGLELQAVKRYADNWMGRLGVAYGDWRQHYDQDGFVDPTNVAVNDGNLVAVQSAGSGDKSRVYLNAKWQVNLSAVYTLPWGINAAGNFFARQGYPVGYFQNVIANPGTSVPAYDRSKTLIVSPYDAHRLGTVTELDLSLSKSFRVSVVEATLLADLFNVMNENTILQRQSQIGLLGPNGTNSIREIQSPRILRLGARLTF
jgi:hypothetical protein